MFLLHRSHVRRLCRGAGEVLGGNVTHSGKEVIELENVTDLEGDTGRVDASCGISVDTG